LLIEDYPNQSGPLGIMGKLCESHGNTEESIECWQKYAQLEPDSPDAYFHLGRLAMRRAEYEKAISFWQKSLEIEPDRPGVYGRMATAMTCLGKLDEAIAALQKDIQITPKAFRSHFLLGQAYLQLKNYPEAKKHYQAVIEILPSDMNAYYGLATACARLGEKEEAVQYRREFKRLQQENLEALQEQSIKSDDLRSARRAASKTYTETGRHYYRHANMRKAEQFCLRAASLDSRNAACRVYLTEMYRNNNREREALQVYEQLRQIDPEDALTCMNLSVLQIRFKQFDAAERSLEEVIELAPERSTGYDSLAQLYLHLDKKLDEAKELARKAVQLEPIAPNYLTLSQVCEKTGDRVNALSALQRAVELDPANASYKRMLRSLRAKP